MQNLGTVSPAIHYITGLPKDIVQHILNDVDPHTHQLRSARLSRGDANTNVRNCKIMDVPTYSWIGGFIWSYIERANRENFLYDITCFENEMIGYIEYDVGDFYTWHIDQDITNMLSANFKRSWDKNMCQQIALLNGENVRKLSFSLQLSSPDEYEGGELQLLRQGVSHNASSKACAEMITLSKQFGTLTVFDSRVAHRVRKVKSGKRKSLVGWVVGPRWK